MNNKTRNSRFARKTHRQDQSQGQTLPKPANFTGKAQNLAKKRAYGKKIHENIHDSGTRQGTGQVTGQGTGQVTGHRAKKSSNSGAHLRHNPASTRNTGRGREGGAAWIWGAHAARAALSNPKRTIHEILITETAQHRYSGQAQHSDMKNSDIEAGRHPSPKIVLPQVLDKTVPRGAVHQGIAVKAAPLEWKPLEVIADSADDNALILVLDQITDPHNVGAMLRLSSAFGVSALVMQTRKAPPLSGALAKVAVGCLETVPICLETNIANTLLNLQRIGWQVTGLAGETDMPVRKALSGGGKRVIVMGAEGAGLRERVRKSCDQLAKIPMMSQPIAGQAESLNVATAAAIALYEARRELD